MSKHSDHPFSDDEPGKNLPNDPPADDIADIVEFVDEEIAADAELVDVDSAFDAHEPQSTDSAPRVTANPPVVGHGKPSDSVLDDEMAHLMAWPESEADQVSGVFSSAARKESESEVVSHSEVIRAEPLSDSIALDPISEIAKIKTDSDIRASEVEPHDSEMIHETEIVDEVLLDEEEVQALPESAVEEVVPLADEDAIGGHELVDVSDSSVALESFHGASKSLEQEPIVDLDETLAGVEAPEPKIPEPSEPTISLDLGASDDVDIAKYLGEAEAEASAVNLGQKPSVIDPVAEELESGVRLTQAQSPPSVEFDELIVEEDPLAAVDFGAKEQTPPKRTTAKLPKGAPEVVDAVAEDASDDVDIDALLAEDAVPAVEDEIVGVVDDASIEAEPEPALTTLKRGAKSAAVTAPPVYVEPKRRGGWGGLVGGAVLGTLLTAGAATGIWFAAPDLIPTSPNAPKQIAKSNDPVPVVPPPVVDDDDGKAAAAAKELQKELQLAQAKMKELDGQIVELTTKVEAAEKGEQAAKLDLKTAAADSAAIEKTLRDAKILAANEKLEADKIQKLVKDLGDATASLAAVNKALDDAKVEGGAEKGIEKILAAKKDAEDKIGEINKLLTDEKIKAAGAKGVAEVVAAREKLAKERDELDAAIKSAIQELVEGKLVPDGGDPLKSLIAGAKAARTKSDSPLGSSLNALVSALSSVPFGLSDFVNRVSDNAAVAAEINFYRLRESLTPSSEQQIDRFVAALSNRELTDATIIMEANKLAEFVAEKDAKATPAVKAKALYLQGLAQRNLARFADARQTLNKAVEMVKGIDTPWAARIRQSHAEVSDPAVYFIPRIDQLRTDNPKAALKEIDAALVIVPGNPRLAAERGLITLEQSRGKLDDATAATIRADAEAAVKDPATAAAGHYVLGRVEEQSGNYAKAEEHFRQALKDVREGDEQAARIRLSLGRLLLRERIPGATPRPKAPEKEPEKDAAQTEEKVGSFFPLEGLVAAAVIGQVPQTEDADSPEGQARLKEAIDLARQLLSAKDKRVQAQGHMLLGEALSRQGQRTEGLREYVKGLEILYPEAQLSKMLDEHPAFSVPDAAQRLNPLLAEKLYGVGLHYFHLKRYAEAEEQFRQAISYFDKDARYYYFLGMAQIPQGSRAKRDAAYHAWEQASRLEANSRPSTREVNAALERIQGSRRTLLDSYRAKSAGTQ